MTAEKARYAEGAARSREYAVADGAKEYTWYCPKGPGCGIARQNEGKVFSYDRPPPEGHVGEGRCYAEGRCTCIAVPVDPKKNRPVESYANGASANIVEPVSRPRGKALIFSIGILIVTSIVAVFFLGKGLDNHKGSTSSLSALAPIATPVPSGAITIQPNVWVNWDAAKPRASNTFAVDGLVIEASSVSTKDGAVPMLKIKAPTGEQVSVRGVSGLSITNPTMEFGVGKFDSQSTFNQIVMTSYSGGAHCCLNIKVADFVDGTWRVVTIYNLDGDSINFPVDIDKDGILDFSINDDRFNYVFASHAGSWTPPLILNITNGKVVDVTKRGGFRQVLETNFTKAKSACGTGKFVDDGKTYDTEINGACAAYVADGVLLGRSQEAWSFMLDHYDHTNGGGDDPKMGFLPTKCFAPLVNYECPEGENHSFANYPDALRWFLGDNGYLPPVKIAPNSPPPPL